MSDPELEKLLSQKLKRLADEAVSAPVAPVTLTQSNFEKYAAGDKPLFVDFWAVWCGPCKMMEPVVEKLAHKYSGRLVLGKLNVDEEPNLATRYDVFSIPTFMIFKGGRPVDAVIGAVGEAALEQFIQKALSSPSAYR